MRLGRQTLIAVLVVGFGSIFVPLPAARGQDAAQPPAAAGGQAAAEAAPAEPAPQLDKWNDANSIPRSNRLAINWLKLASIFLLFLIWVKSADWINRDSQIFEQGYGIWNPSIFFPMFACLLLLAFPLVVGFPNFIVATIAMAVCYLGAFIPYVVQRNKSVALHQRVFTADWFRYEIAHLLNTVGVKMEAERKAEYEKGAQVDLMAIEGPDERAMQANLLTARQSPGYLLVKELIADMADRRADRSMLDYTQQSVVSRQLIDGFWHNGKTSDRESGDVMLAVMKVLSNLDMADRRKKQEGKFAAKYNNHKYVCQIVSQGVKTGERVVLDLLGGQRSAFKHYEELGMRKKLAEQWAELMGLDKGLLIISGLPEGGITTLTDVSLIETDRLLRDFVSIEEEAHREREIENIDVTTYSAARGESPATILPALVRKYPNVYVCRDFVNPESAKILLNEISDDRLVVTTIQAKDASESLLRMLQKQVPQREFAKTVTAVMCTRLIRKLCEKCKVGYQPTPELSKKLGLPEGKIETIYRSPKPEEIEKPCEGCGGLGFFGRTAIFELLVVDDQIRQILLKDPKLELVKKATRGAGMRSFQEEGVLMIAKGVTSLAELQRVLKQ
ncbi:MAG TPA: ATPase, T2SS/T4P/T4SS family [Lacipirellulaceae bacterium]|jgi:type II secretory ATPase GspE/PulE/Tfp pilus assembly ATPase PilB-like protein